MPGIIGGITSAIIASRAGDNFGENYGEIFKAHDGKRDPSEQAGYQLAALALTLGLAIAGGLFTGFVTSRSWFQPPPVNALFDDRFSWHDCEIEHEQLHELQKQMSMSASNSKIAANVPKTVEDEEDERELENMDSARPAIN